jgi:arabinose-5-phosphate isomerase
MVSTSEKALIDVGKRTIAMELSAIAALSERIDHKFSSACQLILNCTGRIIVTGMGKSGHIGNKITATLSSTGTPAFFLHPAEANHGDLGKVTRGDLVLAISNSGNSAELLTLLPLFKRLSIPLITMTGNMSSALAQAADISLDISVDCEACPLGLAPTSSTTVTLVFGDALAVALLEARGFTAKDFAFAHPGGTLGKRLLLKVKDIMHTNERLPLVDVTTTLRDALIEMTQKGLGMTAVVDGQTLAGIFTDGDLRRVFDSRKDINQIMVCDVMTVNPITISAGCLAAEALGTMENNAVTSLVATNTQQQPVGVVHIQDILRAGIV